VQLATWEAFREAVEQQQGGRVSDTELVLFSAHLGFRALTGEELTRRPPNPELDPRNQGAPQPEELRDVPTPKALRQQVLERDGRRCVCCESRRNLSVHHVQWRRYGGRTAPANLVALCEECHSLVHDRFLILRGPVDALEFLDSRGTALRERATPPLRVSGLAALVPSGRGSRRGDTQLRRGQPGADPGGPCARPIAADAPVESPRGDTQLEPRQGRADSAGPGSRPIAADAAVDPSWWRRRCQQRRRACEVAESAESSRGDGASGVESWSVESPRSDTQLEPRQRSGPQPVTFDDVPDTVDVRWWRRHRHLFRFSAAGELVFEPGFASLDDRAAATPVPGRAGSRGTHVADPGHADLDGDPASEPGGSGGSTDCRGDRADLDGDPASGLAAMVGQDRVRRNLGVAVRAALASGEGLGHVLLYGPAGLGKTTLARALASELGGQFCAVMAPLIREPGVLLRMLTSLCPGAVVFLDEIHGLPPRVAEVLYDALENRRICLTVRAGWEQRSLTLELAPFTLVGATTEEGQVRAPLRSRFAYQERLEFYEARELEQVWARAAAALGLSLDAEACRIVARASRGTPRFALGLLQAVRDEARARRVTRLDVELVRAVLARVGCDERGIKAAEAAYLRALERGGGPVGVSTLAARLGTSRRNLKRTIEPFLLRAGLVRVTPRGRALTPAGRQALARWLEGPAVAA